MEKREYTQPQCWYCKRLAMYRATRRDGQTRLCCEVHVEKLRPLSRGKNWQWSLREIVF